MQGKSEIPVEMIRAAGLTAITPPRLRPEDFQRLGKLQIPSDKELLEDRTFYAYAPDPDADYEAGRRAGYQQGLNAPSPVRWQHKQVARPVELIKLAVAIAAIVLITLAMVS